MSKEKLSRILGLRLLTIREGAECGAIRELVLDVEQKAVKFLVLDTGKGCFGFRVLPNEKIAGMGKDFAITDSSEYVSDIWTNQQALDLSYTDSDLIGARVVSSSGDVVGKIVDFEFELVEGTITTYVMEDGGVLPKESIVTLSRGIVFIDKEKIEDAVVGYTNDVPVESGGIAIEFAPEPEPAPVAAEVAPEPIVEEPAPEPVVEEAPEPVVVEPEPEPEPAPAEPEPVAAPEPEPEPVAEEPQEQETAAEPEPAEQPAQAPEEPTTGRTTASDRLAALRNRASAAAQSAAATTPPPAAEGNEDMKSYFEKRRTEFLIGKVVKQRIVDAEGNVLVDVGETVTAEMIEKIKAADKIIELTMGVN